MIKTPGDSNDALASKHRMVRKRYGGPRSKTGCITCRIRHVKCDEGKPACSRCTKTGRKCDGYPEQAWEIANVSSMATILKMSSDPRTASNHHAGRSFKFFEIMTAGYLGGLFDHSLWQEVLRASQHNDAMWHATTALGSAHEAYLHRKFDMQSSEEDWAIQQYNRAMRSLRKSDAHSEQPPLNVIMAASILFMVFEMLRREYGKAISHIKSGINIFAEHTSRVARNSNRGLRSPTKDLISIAQLEHVLRQLETHLCEISLEHATGPTMPRRNFVSRKASPQDATDWSPSTVGFKSVMEARLELDGYWNNMMFVLEELSQPDVITTIISPDALLERRLDFQQAFASWRHRFDILAKTLKTRPTPLTARERKTMAQVEIYHLTGVQILETCLEPDELVWDRYRHNFEQMLNLCDIIVNTDLDKDDGGEYGGFQLDQGIVGPCFQTMWKCRAAKVRRRAIRLLDSQQRQEGLWDAQLVAKVGWLMDEMERGPGLLEEAAARDAAAEEIPRWRRIVGVDVQFSSEGRYATISLMMQQSQEDDSSLISRHILNW